MPPRKNTNPYHTGYGSYYNNTWKTAWKPTKVNNWPTSNYSCNSPKFKTARFECQWRMGSYRNIYSQFAGHTTTPFSPTLANKWVRYINAGVRVYKFNNTEFAKYFGHNFASFTPTAARQFLKQKFGAGIKDVTRGNNNCWLIATTKNVTGRPFNAYTWT